MSDRGPTCRSCDWPPDGACEHVCRRCSEGSTCDVCDPPPEWFSWAPETGRTEARFERHRTALTAAEFAHEQLSEIPEERAREVCWGRIHGRAELEFANVPDGAEWTVRPMRRGLAELLPWAEDASKEVVRSITITQTGKRWRVAAGHEPKDDWHECAGMKVLAVGTGDTVDEAAERALEIMEFPL